METIGVNLTSFSGGCHGYRGSLSWNYRKWLLDITGKYLLEI